jgi:crystallin alpha B
MSLVPLLLDDLLHDLRRPASLFDQHFGRGMVPDDLLDASVVGPVRVGYYRPWRNQAARQSGVSKIQHDKEGFKVNLDVQQFKPHELTVKTVNNFVVVEGKHEERQDEHGFVSRQFQRRYKLPDDVEADTVVSQLSSDGVLTVFAPRKALPAPTGERIVPISHTKAPALKAEIPKADETQKMES